MSTTEAPYLIGQGEATRGPLSRFLPPIPDGIITSWLKEHVKPGSWVLDPFGASPRLVVEAARAGYRILVAMNNPIARFMLEALSAGLEPREYQSALAELAASRKGDERLELHIQSLYSTICARCGKSIPAQAFLWERGAKNPYARLYICPNCGDEGERPIHPGDIERLSTFGAAGLARARALERVASLDDPARPDVEEALSCYLPRPLYALFTMINKLEGLTLSPRRRLTLTALLVSICDQANTLWTYPTARARPRQLSVPPRFRENNLWFSLEEALVEWTQIDGSSPIPLHFWPDQPGGPGICLFQGRMKELAAALPEIPIQAVCGAFPRPNQAFWTLSALWSGWIWGRESVTPLKSALVRRRYDWGWHTTALESVLAPLPSKLVAETPFFGLLAEPEATFLSAAILAAATAGFSLRSMAIRGEQNPAQICWVNSTHPASTSHPLIVLKKGLREYLCQRGEPAPYFPLHCAGLVALAKASALQRPAPGTRGPDGTASVEPLGSLQTLLRQAFADPALLTRYGGTEHSLETGAWWLADPSGAQTARSDQVEITLVRQLQKGSTTIGEIERLLCEAFPALLTPPRELIQVCLESYGEQDPAGKGLWRLRQQDLPSTRRADLKEMQNLLHLLGERLGYHPDGESPCLWLDDAGRPVFIFYLLASTVVSPIVFANRYPSERCLIVLPGSRANLMSYKLRQNPRLAQEIDGGWRFIKFRHLRSLADNPLLNRETWLIQVDRDPPEYVAAQMNMF